MSTKKKLLNRAVKASLAELTGDAKRYLELEQHLQNPKDGKSTEDLSDIYVQITVLKIHSTHLQELMDETEALAALSSEAK
jgi:hypothetical protein